MVAIVTFFMGSAFAALDGIRSLKEKDFGVKPLQEYTGQLESGTSEVREFEQDLTVSATVPS